MSEYCDHFDALFDDAADFAGFAEILAPLDVIDHYTSFEDLQAAVPYPTRGSWYAVGASVPYDYYVYTEGGWLNNGVVIQGPVGPRGATGPQGPIGPQGPVGPHGAGVNQNLIDNWYLLNPINQRGQSSYTGSGYGFDRWSTNFSGDTTSLTTDGIKVLTTSTTGGWHFHQIFLDAEQLIGKSVTLSVDVSAMNGTSMRWRCSFRDSKSSSTSQSQELTGSFSLAAGLGITSGSATVPTGTKAIWIGLYASSGVTSGDYVTTRRVKLEIGTASTLEDDVPDTTAELLKCQRYFVRYGGEISLYGYSSSNGTTAYAQMIFPVSPAAPMDCSLLSEGITVISDTGRTTGNVFSMGSTTRENRQPVTITGLSLTPYRPILAKFDAAVDFSCEP